MPWTVGGCVAWPLYLALPGPRMICMRASDLPAAAPRTASQHPISLSSIRPATCCSIERSEVPRCPPNGPTIDGKDVLSAGARPVGLANNCRPPVGALRSGGRCARLTVLISDRRGRGEHEWRGLARRPWPWCIGRSSFGTPSRRPASARSHCRPPLASWWRRRAGAGGDA